MGCGSSTDSVKSESKASLGTAVSSKPGSSTRPTPTLQNKARMAPEAVIYRGRPALDDWRQAADDQRTNSGVGSATKTGDGRQSKLVEVARVSTDNAGDDDQADQKAAVAFDVGLGDGQAEDGIAKGHPPRRLQKLGNTATRSLNLTLEELNKQQEISAARRKEFLKKKAKISQQSSRRRVNLLAAVQYSQEHQQQVTAKKLDEKRDSASKNREKHQAEKVMKKQIRESKAKEARVRRLRASLDDDNYTVEIDETFNADDDVDSWLDGENNDIVASPITI